jgi:hypothetical protein
MLSKSKYIAGLQCTRRLWLACHEPDLAGPQPDALSAPRHAYGLAHRGGDADRLEGVVDV